MPFLSHQNGKTAQEIRLLDSGDGFMNGLSDVVNILSGQATHVDAATGHQIDVLLLHQVLHLLGCEIQATINSFKRVEVCIIL